MWMVPLLPCDAIVLSAAASTDAAPTPAQLPLMPLSTPAVLLLLLLLLLLPLWSSIHCCPCDTVAAAAA